MRSGLQGFEVRVGDHARDRILLEAHGGNEYAMDHVVCSQDQIYIAVCRQD